MKKTDFQIYENKILFSFINKIQHNEVISKDILESYFNTTKEYFAETGLDCEKYIFAIFMQNYLINIRDNGVFNEKNLLTHIELFSEINPLITFEDTKLFYHTAQLYSVFEGPVEMLQDKFDELYGVYQVAPVDVSIMLKYWTQNALLKILEKIPTYNPMAALQIIEDMEVTVFEFNQIKSLLKGVGETLWH